MKSKQLPLALMEEFRMLAKDMAEEDGDPESAEEILLMMLLVIDNPCYSTEQDRFNGALGARAADLIDRARSSKGDGGMSW